MPMDLDLHAWIIKGRFPVIKANLMGLLWLQDYFMSMEASGRVEDQAPKHEGVSEKCASYSPCLLSAIGNTILTPCHTRSERLSLFQFLDLLVLTFQKGGSGAAVKLPHCGL